ncbi:MAG: hypothetical protein AB7J34_19080 [Limisphaerales bacterium]
MRNSSLPSPTASARTLTLSVCLLVPGVTGSAATVFWEAFNDYRPTDGITSPNATGYDLRVTDDGGILRDIATGADLPVSVYVVVEGDLTPDDFGANSPVNAGSPADLLFQGKVDVGNSGIPGVRASGNTSLILNFSGLNPARRYNFRGTASRGGNYNDRWSLFTLSGTEAFADAHVDGSANLNIFTKATFPASDLAANQVALNTGDNKAGSLVGWDNIEPGADGIIEISAQQYTGVAPFGTPSAAAYSYGFVAIYLAEVESTGSLRITENPANRLVPAGKTAVFQVGATGGTLSYQWERQAPGAAVFADVAGATQARYETPVLGVADDGAKYRCRVTSGANSALSGEATLRVDGVIPSVAKVTGSINFNAVYVSFSEPMNLVHLADKSKFTLSGGLTVSSAIALDPVTTKLVTSAQTPGTHYSVGISTVEDVAGNPVPDTSLPFVGFTVQTGAVGVEIWRNITGSAVADLRANTRYPAEPDVDFSTSSLNSELVVPNGPDNTYGGRLRAWLTPEETAEYEFFLRGDDTAEFRISTDDKFDNLDSPDFEPDAVDSSSGDTFQEPGLDLSTSIPIALEKGRRYAIQAIWKESNGNDYCQVAWRKIGDSTAADQLLPIESKFLSYYGPGALPVEPTITRTSLQNGRLTIEWTGGGLESSTDLKVWNNESGATKPHSVAVDGVARFYRARD